MQNCHRATCPLFNIALAHGMKYHRAILLNSVTDKQKKS